jgi:hypothetical protein
MVRLVGDDGLSDDQPDDEPRDVHFIAFRLEPRPVDDDGGTA